MLYGLLRKFLFRYEPEQAHDYTLRALRWAKKTGLSKLLFSIPDCPMEVMGLKFKNPVGLAAGFDKNGDVIAELATLGFGFIEVGTVTRIAQVGNPPPRVFRIPEQQALINRLGFNNKGCDYLVSKLKKIQYAGILGVNIGKNYDTPLEHAVEDYLYCYRRVAPYASYVTLNISSPNTKALRDLQQQDMLQKLLRTLKEEQAIIFEFQKKYVPLVVKLAPDLTTAELQNIAKILLAEKADGVIATNTTVSREGVNSKEEGGLSGKPLGARSTAVIKQLHVLLNNKIPIIGCGGILNEKDALDKFQAGATLVQLYTGLVYQGPVLIHDIVRTLVTKH
jgi:dihydroorotate dehydrogenase